jgi:hypothetical protein
MPQLILTRFCYGDQGTFGRLVLPSGICLFTVERPWLDNRPSISCIPEGRYEMRPRNFFRGGYGTFEIQNVPDRTHILLHVANRPHEVEGCIGLGVALSPRGDAVIKSRKAFAQFSAEAGNLWVEFKALSIVIQSVHAVLAAQPLRIHDNLRQQTEETS